MVDGNHFKNQYTMIEYKVTILSTTWLMAVQWCVLRPFYSIYNIQNELSHKVIFVVFEVPNTVL